MTTVSSNKVEDVVVYHARVERDIHRGPGPGVDVRATHTTLEACLTVCLRALGHPRPLLVLARVVQAMYESEYWDVPEGAGIERAEEALRHAAQKAEEAWGAADGR